MAKIYVGIVKDSGAEWFSIWSDALSWLRGDGDPISDRKLIEIEGTEIVLDFTGDVLRFE